MKAKGKRKLQRAVSRAKEKGKGEEYDTPHRLQKMQNVFDTVDNPNQIHETLIGKYGTRLKGDNRGFDPFSDKYRTRVDVYHDVGVPFHSSYPNITYYYEGTVYKNGNFILRGSHDKAPNHEIYARNAFTDLRPLTAYT